MYHIFRLHANGVLWTWIACTGEGLLCIADVSIVHQHGSLVGISNHGIGHLTTSTEAQPVAIPCVVKLHSTQRRGPADTQSAAG